MIQRLSTYGFAVVLLFVGLSPAIGQQDLELINKPKTVPEFWRAVKFEISQGKYDLAADFLKGLLALNPTEKDLLAIEDREGVAAFLDLRNVQKWSDRIIRNCRLKRSKTSKRSSPPSATLSKSCGPTRSGLPNSSRT